MGRVMASGRFAGPDVVFADLRIPDDAVETAAATLSPEELSRALRLHSAPDRRRFIVSHAALRTSLSRRVSTTARAIELRRTPLGKPRLTGPHAVEFSMSRAGDVAAFAFADVPVGIDIVARTSAWRLEESAAEFCSASELRSITGLAGERRAEALARIWARKEALLKASGEGLARDPTEVTVSEGDPSVPGGWTITLASGTWIVRDIPAPQEYLSALAHRLA